MNKVLVVVFYLVLFFAKNHSTLHEIESFGLPRGM
jgi:hypothetical protein